MKRRTSVVRTLCCVLHAVLVAALGLAEASPQQDQGARTVAEHLAGGMELLRSGKTQAALAEFQAASRLDPRSVQALVLVGVAENQLGKGQEAVSAFRHALELDPNSEAAHYNLALSLAQLNQPDQAIHELRAVLKLNPRLTTANYNLGVLLEKQGDYEGAIQALQAARDSQPGDSATLVHLVTDCLKAGKNSQAVSLAQDAASRDAKGDLSIQLALLLMEHSHFKEAVQLLETARSRVPASGELNLTLARAYIGAGQAQKAIGLLRTSQSEDSSWRVSYLAGLAYMSLNDAVSSIASFREAVRLAPNQPKVHFQLGRLLLASTSESEQNEGIQELTQAISLEPREIENYAVLGRWLLEHEYVKDAISVLEPGIRNSPPSAVLEVMMALAQAALHGGAAARPFAEKALQLDPKMALALYMVGFSYLNAGDYAEAANYYKQATEIDPRNDIYFFNLAVALWRLNRAAEALSYAQRSAALNPGRGLNHYLLGKICMKLNRDDEARTELETSIRLNPKLENSYYLLSQVYARMGNASEAQAMQEKLAQLRQLRDKAVQFESPESDPAELLTPSRILKGHDGP